MNAFDAIVQQIIAIPYVRTCKKSIFLQSFKVFVTIIQFSIETFFGRYSTLQTTANGMIPEDDMKTTNDKHTTGIHANADKSYPFKVK